MVPGKRLTEDLSKSLLVLMVAFGDATQLIRSGPVMVSVVLGNLLMEVSSKLQLELITDFGVLTLLIKSGLEK